jgi:hypothetical protein
MPWSVDREDGVVRADLTLPIDDWEAVLDAIQAALYPPPVAVFLPATLAGATQVDRELLDSLWRTLRSQGMVVQPLP